MWHPKFEPLNGVGDRKDLEKLVACFPGPIPYSSKSALSSSQDLYPSGNCANIPKGDQHRVSSKMNNKHQDKPKVVLRSIGAQTDAVTILVLDRQDRSKPALRSIGVQTGAVAIPSPASKKVKNVPKQKNSAKVNNDPKQENSAKVAENPKQKNSAKVADNQKQKNCVIVKNESGSPNPPATRSKTRRKKVVKKEESVSDLSQKVNDLNLNPTLTKSDKKENSTGNNIIYLTNRDQHERIAELLINAVPFRFPKSCSGNQDGLSTNNQNKV